MYVCMYVSCREAVCTIFMMVFGMTRPGGELTTYDLPCERRTRSPLSQPDTVLIIYTAFKIICLYVTFS